MKRAILVPIAMLGAVLAFSLWNSAAMSAHVLRWQGQLCQAGELARQGAWAEAAEALEDSYQDWSGQKAYLHIVAEHDAAGSVEAMYRRAKAFLSVQEDSEFLAELAGLQEQLQRLAEMEEFRIENVL